MSDQTLEQWAPEHAQDYPARIGRTVTAMVIGQYAFDRAPKYSDASPQDMLRDMCEEGLIVRSRCEYGPHPELCRRCEFCATVEGARTVEGVMK